MRVFLEGGPEGIPAVFDASHESIGEKVKIPYRGGYEHFEATPASVEHEGEALPVYRWCGRTSVAE